MTPIVRPRIASGTMRWSSVVEMISSSNDAAGRHGDGEQRDCANCRTWPSTIRPTISRMAPTIKRRPKAAAQDQHAGHQRANDAAHADRRVEQAGARLADLEDVDGEDDGHHAQAAEHEARRQR